MNNVNSHKKAIVVITGLLVLSMSLSSCDSLRQKFTRKKNKAAEEQAFVPVLVPEEYPEPKLNPEYNYKEHYALIKAWYVDLWEGIRNLTSTARYLHYILKEVTEHITQMETLVDAPTQAQLVKLAGYLDYYKSSLDVPWQARNVPRMQGDLRGFDRFLRDHLRADRIQGHFVKALVKSKG